jgi:gluconokinase
MPSLTADRSAIVVMGVCGCGKSTFAEALAARLGLLMIDGDDLHAETAVATMKSGQPLSDNDRWPWLDNVAAVLGDLKRAPLGIVGACSALKRVYRDRIRSGSCEPRFVFLGASYDLITARMKER